MNNEDIKKKMAELSEAIFYHKDLYYNKSEPEISDYEFDQIVKELEELETKYPSLKEKKSITKSVGAPVDRNKKEKHQYPMLSLSNTYNEEELQSFYKRICKITDMTEIETFCELKIDGVAVSLIYENGNLVKSATRGDGLFGENIYENVLQISSIPHVIPFQGKIEIRGEVFITKKNFQRLNDQKISLAQEPWSNARNLASGTIKLLDKNIVKERNLSFIPYSIFSENSPIKFQNEITEILEKWGFYLPNTYKKATKLDEILEFIDTIKTARKSLDFETDGIVIKVNSFVLQNIIGQTTHSPKWAVAYKYKSESAFSQLQEVIFQVGRTGAVTPVALFDPVNLAGSIVHKASLHNKEHIEKLDIFEEDILEIEKGGEVIPKIIGVDKNKRKNNTKRIEFIEKCPSCNFILEKIEEKILYCKNHDQCPDQQIAKVQHFISKDAMNMNSLGRKTVEILFEKKLITKAKDLYSLKYEDLIFLPGFKEVSVQNVLRAIEESKKEPFHRFIFSLGIKHVGEVAAKALAKYFGSIDKMISAKKEDFKKIDEIGEKMTDTLYNFFQKRNNIEDLEDFKNFGLTMEEKFEYKEIGKGKFYSKKVVITGTFPNLTRDQIIEIIEKEGGKILSAISKKTDILLIGEDPSITKIEKATALGIEILNDL